MYKIAPPALASPRGYSPPDGHNSPTLSGISEISCIVLDLRFVVTFLCADSDLYSDMYHRVVEDVAVTETTENPKALLKGLRATLLTLLRERRSAHQCCGGYTSPMELNKA